jgi:hypothetical protein
MNNIGRVDNMTLLYKKNLNLIPKVSLFGSHPTPHIKKRNGYLLT